MIVLSCIFHFRSSRHQLWSDNRKTSISQHSLSVSLEGINNNELNSFAAWQLTIAFISFAKQLSYANSDGVWYR